MAMSLYRQAANHFWMAAVKRRYGSWRTLRTEVQNTPPPERSCASRDAPFCATPTGGRGVEDGWVREARSLNGSLCVCHVIGAHLQCRSSRLTRDCPDNLFNGQSGCGPPAPPDPIWQLRHQWGGARGTHAAVLANAEEGPTILLKIIPV